MQTDLWGDPGPLACQPRSSPGSHGRALCRATADLANVFSSISVGREDPKPFAFTRNGQKCTFTARPRSRVRAPAPLITWAGEPRPPGPPAGIECVHPIDDVARGCSGGCKSPVELSAVATALKSLCQGLGKQGEVFILQELNYEQRKM